MHVHFRVLYYIQRKLNSTFLCYLLVNFFKLVSESCTTLTRVRVVTTTPSSRCYMSLLMLQQDYLYKVSCVTCFTLVF